MKLKYGDNLNEGSEDEDSSETEDEDAVLDTPDKDVKFLQLLPLINKQVPQINTLSEPIFKPEDDADDDGDDNNAKATVAADDDKPRRREKAIRLNDYIRQQLLEHGPEAMLDADDDRKRPRSEVAASKTLTYVGEQDELKKNFLSAFDEALEPNDDDAEKKIGGVLQIRSTAKPLKTLRKIENVDSTIVSSLERELRLKRKPVIRTLFFSNNSRELTAVRCRICCVPIGRPSRSTRRTSFFAITSSIDAGRTSWRITFLRTKKSPPPTKTTKTKMRASSMAKIRCRSQRSLISSTRKTKANSIVKISLKSEYFRWRSASRCLMSTSRNTDDTIFATKSRAAIRSRRIRDRRRYSVSTPKRARVDATLVGQRRRREREREMADAVRY